MSILSAFIYFICYFHSAAGSHSNSLTPHCDAAKAAQSSEMSASCQNKQFSKTPTTGEGNLTDDDRREMSVSKRAHLQHFSIKLNKIQSQLLLLELKQTLHCLLLCYV